MTGHRKPWIVRKNRRYRRKAFTRWYERAVKKYLGNVSDTPSSVSPLCSPMRAFWMHL